MTDLINELIKDIEDFLLEVDKMIFAPLQKPSKQPSTPTSAPTPTSEPSTAAESVTQSIPSAPSGSTAKDAISSSNPVEQPIPTTTTIPAWGSSAKYTVPVSTAISTGQQQTKQLMAWWAPDVWAGLPSSQWRKVPVAPACQNTPLGGVCAASSFNLKIGTVYAASPQYFHNVWGCWFAWPMDYSPTLDQINRLAGIGSVNKSLCQQG